MIRSVAVLCCFAVCAGLVAQEPRPIAGTGPVPATDLVPPQVDETAPMTEEQALRDRLRAHLDVLDRRIGELLAEGGANPPPVTVPEGEELEESRRQRDAAWRELTETLKETAREEARGHLDRLDVPPDRTTDPEVRAMENTNAIKALRCYHALQVAGQLEPGQLRQAAERAAALELDEVEAGERARLLYLRFWFALEQARQAQPAARTEHLKAADRQLTQLEEAYPGSEFATTARLARDTFVVPGAEDEDGDAVGGTDG